MKLLLDANLSWRLCGDLKDHFEEVQHVDAQHTTSTSFRKACPVLVTG